jgi:hypothetical protein
MQQIFDPEIAAWNDALAHGQTLIDHLSTQHGTEQTQALTGSEVDFISEDEFDEESIDDEVVDSEQATAMHGAYIDPQPLIPIEPPRTPHTPFPTVPPEWRASQPQLAAPAAPVASSQRVKQILIAGSVAFALIVLAIAILVGTPAHEKDEPSVIRMPTAVTPADATTR